MHPVQDKRWNLEHRGFTGRNLTNCRPCHGHTLTGTTLSETAAERVLFNKRGEQVVFPEGHRVGCGDCHKQKR